MHIDDVNIKHRQRSPQTRNAQSGQAIVWVAVLFPFLLAVIGLAIDGGLVFNARRELQNAADAAARAGAMQIDMQVYDATNGQTVVLNQGVAAQVATTYAASQGVPLSASIATTPRGVVVHTSRTVPTTFLQLLGFPSVQIQATANAEVRYGISQGNR